MDWLTNLIWYHGHFLGVQWSVWKLVGWVGNAVFFSRFMVQWYATEKLKQVVVPVAFWWFSLTGALLLFSYAVHQRDSVFICAYVFTWIPYTRNLIIHRRHTKAHMDCPECGTKCPPKSLFCHQCGTPLMPAASSGSGRAGSSESPA